jgi:hypothetical protein
MGYRAVPGVICILCVAVEVALLLALADASRLSYLRLPLARASRSLTFAAAEIEAQGNQGVAAFVHFAVELLISCACSSSLRTRRGSWLS